MPGVVKVVVRKNFVGVVAEKPWQAMQAARELKATWTPGPPLPAHDTFYDHLRHQPSRDAFVVNSGDVDQTLARSYGNAQAGAAEIANLHGSILWEVTGEGPHCGPRQFAPQAAGLSAATLGSHAAQKDAAPVRRGD